MMERFNDIIDVEFTAGMENQLDAVEEGKRDWKAVLAEFYQDFHQEMVDAEEALNGVRLKVPEEETEELCDLCGRKMVIKVGRFGKFLACPGWPECKSTKPLVERMPGRCPKCGSGLLKRKSKRGYAFFACEQGQECGFMSWDVPTELDCPECGKTMFKKSGKGRMKPFCINEACSKYLPEDKRGYYKKKETDASDKKKTAKGKTSAGKGKKK
jgi:DNA topoisomerase-1